MLDINKFKKGLFEFRNFVIVFILIIFIMIIIPFTPLVLVFFIFIIGEPTTYIIQNIIYNLYGSLLLILLFMLLIVFFRIQGLIYNFNVGIKYIALNKALLKQMVIFLVALFLILMFSVTSFKNLNNLIADIPHSVQHDYAKMDGVLKLVPSKCVKESDDVMINGIQFEGGISHFNNEKSFEEGFRGSIHRNFFEGKLYHVEYLPHSKYIVRITEIR
ncbi:MAG: hypothetical protein H6Q73_300 [Firmicutes bacterium]|nr:hypothetical protein [Bacillota bacterium]